MVQFNDGPRAAGLMANPKKFRKALPGGARIACGEAPGPKETMAPNRPQDNGMLPGQANTNAGQLPPLSPKQYSTKVSLGDGVGFTGLNNLGNTCFMSCVLQALGNNKDLRDYFLSKTYLQDINVENPLGSKGRLAKSFFLLLKHLWSGDHKSYAPTNLKKVVDTIAPQFMGFMQHDAQEFMAFFLDALHEDLNRVQVKPVFEIPELGDRDEYFIANKSWTLHRSRNDSFIVDKFHGMYKSKLTCPTCKKESTTFDPFLFLPVPIPKPMKWITVTFFSQIKGPVEVRLCIPEEGAEANDVLSHITTKFSVSSSCLRLLQTEAGCVVKQFLSNSPLPSLEKSPCLVVCEVADNSHTHVLVLQRIKASVTANACTKCKKTSADPGIKILRCGKCKTGYCSLECQKNHWPQHKQTCRQRFFGCPFMVSLGTDRNCAALRQRLQKMATASVDIFHCSQESADDLDALKQSFSIFACLDGEMTKSILVKEDLSSIELSHISHLIIEWPSEVTVSETNFGKQNVKSHEPSVEDCIRLFTKPEVLAAEEAWYCPKCKEHKEATKEISLWQLPDILIIQLKRFSFRNRIWRDKIDRLVKFPVNELDMRPFCVKNQAEDPIFDLFGVVNHHGGLFGGHYTSYVRLSEDYEGTDDSGWRLCDDSSVTSIRHEDELVTASSYVMFYQRRKQQSSLMTGGDAWNNTAMEEPSYSDSAQVSQYGAAGDEASSASEKIYSESIGDNILHGKTAHMEVKKHALKKDKRPDEQLHSDTNKQESNAQRRDYLNAERNISLAIDLESHANSAKAKREKELDEAPMLNGPLPYTDMDAVD